MVDQPDIPDPDATVMVPRPGRRRPAAEAEPAAAPAPRGEPSAPVDLAAIGGMNPLVAAANPLLAVVPRIRTSASHPDPAGLRESLLRQIAAFEQGARAKGVAPEAIVVARYALCTTIDEAVSHTPWGGTAEWARASLLVTLHREVGGGEKFFQLLNKMAADPGANIDLLELFHVCLALGFEGRFRIIDGGKAQLETVRERLAEMIRKQRGEYERDLAVHWRGEQTQVKKLGSLMPLWATAMVAALVLLGVYLFLSFRLNEASDGIAFAAIRAPVAVPVVKAAPPPPVPPRMAKFLEAEIRRGEVTVSETARGARVVIRGDGLFASGSAQVKSDFEPLLKRIAEAMDDVPGPVLVTGHTDNVPSRSLRFPSNWHLSKARADTVVGMIAAQLKDPKRVTGEGRADAEPIAANDTPENRALNRRVEIYVANARGA